MTECWWEVAPPPAPQHEVFLTRLQTLLRLNFSDEDLLDNDVRYFVRTGGLFGKPPFRGFRRSGN